MSRPTSAQSAGPSYKIGVVLALGALVMLWRITVIVAIVAPIGYLVWMLCKPRRE